MKKTIIITIAIMLLVVIAGLLYNAHTLYRIGYSEGIRHAIEDANIWTVECYNPDDPDSTARSDGTDQTIYITLDGETYEHGMYQG